MESPSPEEVARYISQMQNKRDYNRKYYQERTKIKRETEKQELERLRATCSDLQNQLAANTETRVQECQIQVSRLLEENVALQTRLEQVEAENITLSNALQVARQKNYDLIMLKADDILPRLKGAGSESPLSFPLPFKT